MTQDVHIAEMEPPGPANRLVGLPPHIRRRIYFYTGLARLDGNPYTYYLGGVSKRPHPGAFQSEWDISNFDPPPTRNFAGLLRSCRALCMETTALFYSANRFVIFHSPQRSFEKLCSLSPTALASLTSLRIILNKSCHRRIDPSRFPPYCWCDGHADENWAANHHCTYKRDRQRGTISGHHRRPLLELAAGADLTTLASGKQEVQLMMGEWCDAVASISPHIGIGRLELLFFCDIDPEGSDALEAARLALAPLTLFPRLRDCHVRLSEKPNYAFQQMAQDTVLQAYGRRVPPARLSAANLHIFSYLTNLPSQLRIRVLEYTDLVTPWKEVTWSRQTRGYQVVRALCFTFSARGPCQPDVHNGCRLSTCEPGLEPAPGYEPYSGCCFCRVRHSAFSFGCNCWAPPTNLFLICRTLYREAQFVFFSRNRFIVHDFRARLPWFLPHEQYNQPVAPDTINTSTENRYPFERLTASEFLRDIVPTHCLGYLRFLELVFPPYLPNAWPRQEDPAGLDWAATVNWLREQIKVPALTLRVVMADFYTGPIKGRVAMTQALMNDICTGYRCIIGPLRPLVRATGGLAGFHMQLAHPSRWTDEVRRRAEQDEAFLGLIQGELDNMVERWVWGPKRLLPRGGPDNGAPSESTWQRWRGVDVNGD